MSDNSKGTRLPAEVRRAAAQLRRAEPSDGFDDRLREALCQADQEALDQFGAPAPSSGFAGLQSWSAFVRAAGFAAAGATAMVLALLWFQPDNGEDVLHRMAELELVLESDGHSWLPLTLETDHHDGAHAHVYVEAPKELEVRASEHADGGQEPTCGPRHCVHRFAHPTSAPADHHLAIGVSEPGEYRITVEHASPKQKVREVFVVAVR